MSEHTATTTVTLAITTTVEGDEGVEPDYLVDVIMWGLEQHNGAVAKLGDSDPWSDYAIQPLAITIIKKDS